MKLSHIATLIVVLTALTLTAAACGDSKDSSSTKSSTTPSPKTTTTTSTDANVSDTPDEAPAPTCSSTDLNLQLPDDSTLPEPVAITRQKLFDAAMGCDFDALGAIVEKDAKIFKFSYGVEKNPVIYWQASDKDSHTMARLAQILTTPVVKKHEGALFYAWPSAYIDKPTTAQWQELQTSGAYSADEITSFKKTGVYLGYRVGITPKGNWAYFIAGD